MLIDESRDVDDDEQKVEEEKIQLLMTIKQMTEVMKMARRFYDENNIQKFDTIYEMEECRCSQETKITEFIHWIPQVFCVQQTVPIMTLCPYSETLKS